jgi:lipopolysaccharide export LptBFGC system permease protein LptF
MLGIINRYLLREVLVGWLAITLVLWLIMISHRTVGYLYRIMQFDRQGVRVELPGRTTPSSKRSAIPTDRLLGSTDIKQLVELQWRLSVPVSVMVLVIYFNLMGTAKAWVEQGAIPPVIGIWWVHLLPVMLAAILLNGGRRGCRLKQRS